MNTRLIALSLALVLCGCVFSNMQGGLNSLIGQPLDTAVATLGLPSGEQTVAGRISRAAFVGLAG